jgi:ribosome-associated heat shock protein Hsp15
LAENRQRLDKWLWFARVTKSRTLAQKLIATGHVRINREKTVDSSDPVKPGDVLTISQESGVRILKVAGPGLRRGPPPEARLLYEDLTPPAPPRPERAGARPTKRDRRAIEDFRQGRDDDREN